MDNASVQSHERPQPQPQPFASNQGSNRISNQGKAPTDTTNTPADSKLSRSRVPCRFYPTKKGCRAGDACPFLHVEQPISPEIESPETRHGSSRGDGPDPEDSTAFALGHDQGNDTTHGSRRAPRPVVARPVPATQQRDPRGFQISQVETRFNSVRHETEQGTVLVFKLVPSDPDFPFELDGLQCTLTIPMSYPTDGRPSLRVHNQEMERGYQINVERGFDSLINRLENRTLLSFLNELDKKLEAFLTAEKAQTIKIVPHAPRKEATPAPKDHPVPAQEYLNPLVPPPLPTVRYSDQQKIDARLKRESDMRQLDARLRNVPLFSKSADGKSFNLPLTIPKPARLPLSLQLVKEMTLFVPLAYNLEPCTIKIEGVAGVEARNVETAFEEHSRVDSSLTLMAHVNYMFQNMHLMAKKAPRNNPQDHAPVVSMPKPLPTVTSEPSDTVRERMARVDEDRPHVQYIQRPPEWELKTDESDDESSDLDSEDYTESEGEDNIGGEEGGAALPASNAYVPVSGNSILVSFPDIELYGIELMEVASLSLTLKCDRCKSTVDAKNIKARSGDTTTTVSESCPKCSVILTARFTSEALHANSIKAGHLDLGDCTVADMLPSVFKPTCSSCSTTCPNPPGVVSVRGETTLSICRECHQKMTFKIPEVKFLRVSSALASTLPLRQRKKKENLGITTGSPLPEFGQCSHYRKSRRWFRFSCCNKVFPCDRCHDEQADPKHPNEHANRMICGYCSREQNYRPDDCGVCGRGLVGKKGGGFWEGGKGTRDKVKMSRKDPRKFKRRGGGGVKKS